MAKLGAAFLNSITRDDGRRRSPRAALFATTVNQHHHWQHGYYIQLMVTPSRLHWRAINRHVRSSDFSKTMIAIRDTREEYRIVRRTRLVAT
jgi:hypothetical protein